MISCKQRRAQRREIAWRIEHREETNFWLQNAYESQAQAHAICQQPVIGPPGWYLPGGPAQPQTLPNMGHMLPEAQGQQGYGQLQAQQGFRQLQTQQGYRQLQMQQAHGQWAGQGYVQGVGGGEIYSPVVGPPLAPGIGHPYASGTGHPYASGTQALGTGPPFDLRWTSSSLGGWRCLLFVDRTSPNPKCWTSLSRSWTALFAKCGTPFPRGVVSTSIPVW